MIYKERDIDIDLNIGAPYECERPGLVADSVGQGCSWAFKGAYATCLYTRTVVSLDL